MLPRSLRIAREHFNNVFRSAQVYRSSLLVLYAKPSKELGFAVVVAKKVAKRAVDRHRIKRIVLSVVESELQQCSHTLPPCTFVFRVLQQPNHEDQLRIEATELLQKALKEQTRI